MGFLIGATFLAWLVTVIGRRVFRWLAGRWPPTVVDSIGIGAAVGGGLALLALGLGLGEIAAGCYAVGALAWVLFFAATDRSKKKP